MTERDNIVAEVRKLNVNGTERDAIEVQFEIRREDWAEYEFVDGGTMRAKTTVKRIWQVIDEQGNHVRHPNGDRFLVVEHSTEVVTSG